MPGFNRRGPDGIGPGTGRGMGYCRGLLDRGRIGTGGFSAGKGRGSGRRAGYGAGPVNETAFRYGRRGAYSSPVESYGAYRYEDIYPGKDEAETLKEEVAFMEKRIEELHSRIAELENPRGINSD